MSREKLNHLWTTRIFDVIRIKKMRIKVKVITNAKENRVLEEKGGYKVYLSATPAVSYTHLTLPTNREV